MPPFKETDGGTIMYPVRWKTPVRVWDGQGPGVTVEPQEWKEVFGF
ncbi:MAG: hypothetical protein ACYC1U_00125 [Candidatus Aquicultorales bacterium]